MKTLVFYGNSDDTFGEYGVTNQDYNNSASGKPIQCAIDCGEHGRVLVVGQYNDATMGSGCWIVGVTKVHDEDGIFPDWNFRYKESEVPHSPALMMDLPDGEFKMEWYIGGRRICN